MTEEQIKHRVSQGEVGTPNMRLFLEVYKKLSKENKDFATLSDEDKLLKAAKMTINFIENS